MTATPTKRYEHFDQPTSNAEPVIAGVGKKSQMTIKGRVTKWVRLAKMPNEQEQDYQQRLEHDMDKLRKYRSHLLFAKSMDTAGGRVVAIASEQRYIGYSWMPVLGEQPISFKFSKAIVIWLNSTLGRIAFRRVSGRKISFPQLSPINFNAVPFVDIRNAEVVNVLCDCFEDTCDELVPQFRDGRVPIRETWDDAVSQALGIERELIARCADMLARDAFVSKEAFYDQM